jgi:dTDP-4-dehydrorhamnose 3,5-epimerase
VILTETKLKGAYIVELEELKDNRGFFARAWCQHEFEKHGLNAHFVQANVSYSKKKGTLRGLHYQISPYEEIKLMRCTKGSVYDVIIDLRRASSTYAQWIGVELTSENHKMLYVPENFAHGFQTLEDDTEVFYPVSQFYTPGSERGIRYDDPAFGIKWPETKDLVMSEKDKCWPDFVS